MEMERSCEGYSSTEENILAWSSGKGNGEIQLILRDPVID